MSAAAMPSVRARDGKLVEFGELLKSADALMVPPWGIVGLSARLTARAPSGMPYAVHHPDKLMAAIAAPVRDPQAGDPRIPATLAELDRLAAATLARPGGAFATSEGIWLFAAFAADLVRAAPADERALLVAFYETARAA